VITARFILFSRLDIEYWTDFQNRVHGYIPQKTELVVTAVTTSNTAKEGVTVKQIFSTDLMQWGKSVSSVLRFATQSED
jgi:hypothetical protein